jgi:tetratricopeptide (TPR) repeat protein
MTRRFCTLLGASALLAALSGTAGAGTRVNVKAAMNKRITVQLKDKSFEDTIRALCKAAGINDVKVGPGQKPSARSRSSRTHGIGGSTVRYKNDKGSRYYSVTIVKPLPLKDILKTICGMEALTPQIIDGRLVVMDAGQAAAELPFRARDFKVPLGWRIKIPVNRDWRKAVKFILNADAKGMVEDEAGKSYSIAELEKIPSIQCLLKALGALKGHPEKDAVRAWLLSETASRLWGHYHFKAKSVEGRKAMGQVIAIMKEVESLEKSGAIKKGLKELAEVIKKASKESPVIFYAHGNIGWTSPADMLLKLKMVDGYHGAAQAWKHLRDTKAAAKAMRKALYFSMAVYYGGDQLFSHYSSLLPKEERIKAAREGLEFSLKRFAKCKAHFEALPETWKCKGCGEGKKEHIAERAQFPARFHVRLGMALATGGDWAEAVKNYQAALKLDPVNGGYSRNSSAVIRTNRGWVRTRDETPKASHIVLIMARMLHKAGQADKAIEVMKDQIKKTPTNHQLLSQLAGWYAEAGKKAEAIAAYKQYIELRAEAGSDKYVKAALAHVKRRIAVLEGRIVEGPKTDLSNPETRKLHEQFDKEIWKLLRERRYEQGLALLRSDALKIFPGDLRFMGREITFLSRIKGKEAELKEKLLALKKLHPQQANYVDGQLQALARKVSGINEYIRQVFDLSRQGKSDKALELIRAGYAKFPDQQASLASQEVSILKRTKKYDEAAKLARKYAKKYPDRRLRFTSEEIECLIAAGKKDEARKRLKEFEAAVSRLERHRGGRYARVIPRLRAKLEGKTFDPGRRRPRRRR